MKSRKLSYTLGWDLDHGHLLAVNAAKDINARHTVTVGRDTTVRIWDHGKETFAIKDHADSVNDVAIVPATVTTGGVGILTASSDFTVRHFFNLSAVDGGRQDPDQFNSVVAPLHQDAVKRIAVSQTDPTVCVSATLSGVVAFHDIGRDLHHLSIHTTENAIYSVFPLLSNLTFAGSVGGNLYLLDGRAPSSRQGSVASPFIEHAHVGTVRDIVVNSAEYQVVTAGTDGFVRVWDTRTKKALLHCHVHSEAIFTMIPMWGASISHPCTTILTGGRDGCIVVTDFKDAARAGGVTPSATTVAVLDYPVFHLDTNAKAERIVACTSRSTVETFAFRSVLPRAILSEQWTPSNDVSPHRPHSANDESMVSPSKVSIGGILDEEDDYFVRSAMDDGNGMLVGELEAQSDLVPMIPAGSKKFDNAEFRVVEHPSKKARQLWCTSLAHPRIQVLDRTEPSSVLKGSTTAIVEHLVLNDKRHALTKSEDGTINLWNIVSRTHIHTFDSAKEGCPKTLKQASIMCSMDAYCLGWCSVSCRWGGLCVVLSKEEVFNATVNLYEQSRTPSIPTPYSSFFNSETGSNLAIKRMQALSTFIYSQEERLDFRVKRPLNLGETALRALFAKSKESNPEFVVWEPGVGDYRAVRRYPVRGVNHKDTSRIIPSWAQAVLGSEDAQGKQNSGLSNLTIELSPAPDFSGPTFTTTIGKERSAVNLFAEVAKKLKMSSDAYPTFDTFANSIKANTNGQLILKRPTSTKFSLQPEEYFELSTFPTVPKPSSPPMSPVNRKRPAVWPSDDEDDEDTSDSDAALASPLSPQVNAFGTLLGPEEDRIIDPLLAAMTAVYVYKEKGAGVLRLKYRPNRFYKKE